MTRVIGILLFLAVLIWDLFTDLAKLKAGIDINHTLEAVLRALLLIPSLFFLSDFGVLFAPVKIEVPARWILKTLSAALLMVSVYWVVFDGLYNSLRGFGWWFNGSQDYNDGFLDKLLMKMEDWQDAVLKIGLVGLSLFWYINVRAHD